MPNHANYFNKDGVISFSSKAELYEILNSLKNNYEQEYNNRRKAVEDNFIKFRSYASPDDWMAYNCYDTLE